MKEATWHSFRVSTGVLVVDFLEPDSDEKQDYDIAPLGILGETMVEDGESSQFIFHLGMKIWASTSLLYDLATQINKYCPENKINWEKSFLDIELGKASDRYVDNNYVASHTDPDMIALGGMTSADAVGQLMMDLDYRRNITAEEIEKTRLRVKEQLRKRGLI